MTRTMLSSTNPNRSSNTLSISFIKQERETWCWAACLLMIVNHFKGPLDNSQCNLAHLVYDHNFINRICRKLFRSPDCCSSQNTSIGGCNFPANQKHIEFLFRYFNIRYDCATTIAFCDIVREIDQNRPIQIGYCSDNYGHVVLIKGYNSSNNQELVKVNDPAHDKGSGFRSYECLTSYSSDERLVWQYTWKFQSN